MARRSEIQPVKVGHLENTDQDDIVRIVHISDTHMAHDRLLPTLPEGDILIHSGDFLNFYIPTCDSREHLEQAMAEIDKFFSRLPHQHKIFVAGNHEMPLDTYANKPDEISALLPHGHYLSDSEITLDGIRIYGSPWNNAAGMAFYQKDLTPVWEKIPSGIDILVTHLPPFGIKDFGYNKYWGITTEDRWLCEFCTKKSVEPVYHGEYAHHGCPVLRQHILSRIRPKVHLFGHIHNKNGPSWQDGILFSNAALACVNRPTVIDFHKAKTKPKHKYSCIR